MSLITLQIDGNEFDFSLLTEEEITKCIYLYESKKHSDLHKFNSIILSKYVGDHFQSLKEQVDDTPAVLGQIYSRLMALSGTTFPIEFMKRMNRTLTRTSHPIGYGRTLGNYAGEVLKIVLPREKWMEFVKTQPDGKEKI